MSFPHITKASLVYLSINTDPLKMGTTSSCTVKRVKISDLNTILPRGLLNQLQLGERVEKTEVIFCNYVWLDTSRDKMSGPLIYYFSIKDIVLEIWIS